MKFMLLHSVICFEAFYAKYFEPISNPEARRQKCELIKIEHAIHTVGMTIETQNISPHLFVLEEMCDTPIVCDIILLLYRKHETKYNEYYGLYADWTYFLRPYLEFIANIKIDSQKLLHLDQDICKEIIKSHTQQLLEMALNRNFTLSIEQDKLENIEYLSTLMMLIKAELLKESIVRDKQYYQDLGLWSFLFHFINYIHFKDYTVLKSSLCASTYVHLGKMISF